MRNKIKSKVDDSKVERFENTFIVRILGLDVKVPLFILFRALGYESDKKILETIVYENDNDELKSKLYDLLIPSIKSSQPIYTQKNAYKFLSLNTKGKENFNVYDILSNNLFPNYSDNISKCKYLGFIVRKNIANAYRII